MPKGVPNKRYTPEFKQMVVETMRWGNLSVSETKRRFNINDHGIIERWERIYLEEGSEGLAMNGKGGSAQSRLKIPGKFLTDFDFHGKPSQFIFSIIPSFPNPVH